MTTGRILTLLGAIKQAYPHLRLCQVIANAVEKDPFYTEDDMLFECLEAYTRKHLPKARY